MEVLWPSRSLLVKIMSLIIKKNTTFKIPRTLPFLPSSLGGLSLWLKADAGISTTRLTYASQIILTGAYNTDFNGTYTATSEPDGNGNYSLVGPVYTMTYNKGANEYVVAFNSQYNAGSFISNDGVNWSILNSILNPAPYISGITGTYSNGNGQYSYAGDDPRDPSYYKSDNENYYFIGGGAGNWTLTYYEYGGGATVLATNSNTIPSGNWTNVNATGTITSTTALYPDPNQSIPTGSVTTSEYGNLFVASWTDQSANGFIFTVDIQNSPTFVSSFLNGKPAIEFIAGGNTGLSNPSFGLTGFTFFSVAKQKPTNTGRIFSAYNNNVLIGTWGNESNRFYGGNENGWLYEGTDQSTDFLITTAFSDADTSFGFYQNGILQSNGNSNSTVFIDGISVGGGILDGGNGVEASDSYVCEIVIYNRTLTLTERQQVEQYLNSKYQIY